MYENWGKLYEKYDKIGYLLGIGTFIVGSTSMMITNSNILKIGSTITCISSILGMTYVSKIVLPKIKEKQLYHYSKLINID